MKKTPLKSNPEKILAWQQRSKPLKNNGVPMKRTRIKARGQSETARAKENIQALLRAFVIKRDGGCILRNIRGCGAIADSGEVLQADHLVTRANSATYADERLVVCVCRSCHYWKSVGANVNKNQYDTLVRSILPPDRVQLWDRAEEARLRGTSRRYGSDWKLEEVRLKQLTKS